MKSVVIMLEKRVEFTVVVPDDMSVEDLQRVATEVATDPEFDEAYGLDELEWDVVLGRAALVTTIPEEEGLAVLSDDREDFVNPEDAEWWKTAR